MKNKFKFIILFLILVSLPFVVNAEYIEWGEQNGGTTNFGCGNVDSCWPEGESTLAGIRVSLYKLNKTTQSNGETSYTITKIGKSYDFLNKKSTYDELKDATGITFIKAKLGKIDYLQDDSKIVSTKTNDEISIPNLYYYNFANYFSPKKNLEVSAFMNGNKSIFQGAYGSLISGNIEDYYYVLEPLTVIIYKFNTSNQIWFYGTFYEHLRYVKKYGISHGHVTPVLNTTLPLALTITSYESNEGNVSLANFLDVKFKGKLANPNKDDYYSIHNDQKVYKNEVVLGYTYGMYALSAIEYFETTDKKDCNNKVTLTNCGEITINEDNSQVCAFGNKAYYLDSYNDVGKIYCTNSVDTHFNDFYTGMNVNIYPGRYFDMINLTITTNKTCYIKTSKLSSVKGWESKVKENLTGNIALTLGNRTYNLEEEIEEGTVNCVSKSQGVCTKATLETTHTYSLNYLTNRFISIEKMKQDDLINESNCTKEDINKDPKLCQKNNTNTIDNEGPKLTVPLNYLNGVYKYNLNLKNSLLSKFKTRLINTTESVPVEINGQKYSVNYTTDKTINDTDLTFTCPYKVGTGSDCNPNVSKDKCCDENGNEISCPITCQFECCDDEGNEIECPGGDSILGNIIYRPISLTNPFPGIEGDSRLPGSNWNKTVTKGGRTYTATDYYIKYNRGYNDYEIYQTEPLYTINLDANTINYIRNYNDAVGNDYNDLDFTCKYGEKCISDFLRGTSSVDGYNRNLLDVDRSKCYSSDSFETCVTRKG